MKKTWKWIGALAVAAAAAAGFCVWQNNDLTIDRSVLGRGDIPEAFDGYTIVQVSDLHNKEFGVESRRLMSKLAEQEPDIILITGDMIDSRNTDVGAALDFARQAVKLAPCFYVPGNHENRVPEAYEELKAGLADCGVKVLENEKVTIEREGSRIALLGVLDPIFRVGITNEAGMVLVDERSVMTEQLAGLTGGGPNASDGTDFTVLLSHRPEMLDVYAEAGVDLVFTGHAHGGQWRLPGVGGLIAPGQGFFPEFTDGAYAAAAPDGGSTTMYVSRGLGNSLMPVRIFNRPELVVVELRHEIG